MSKAMRATLNCTSVVEFPDGIDFSAGSFYLAALETEEVVLVANQIGDAASAYAGGEKPVVTGAFWEEGIGYEYGLAEEDRHALRISTERKVGHPLVQQLLQAATALG